MRNEMYNSMLQGIAAATYQPCLLLLFSDALYVFVQKSELAFVHKSLTLNSPKYRQNERLSTTGDKRGTKVH